MYKHKKPVSEEIVKETPHQYPETEEDCKKLLLKTFDYLHNIPRALPPRDTTCTEAVELMFRIYNFVFPEHAKTQTPEEIEQNELLVKAFLQKYPK